MVIMTRESREFLQKNLPEVADASSPNVILDPLYDLIMLKGFTKGFEHYNAFGEKAQEVYDDIFYSNFTD